MNTRQCRKCRQIMSISAFSLKRNSTTKLAVRCDQCRASPAAAWASKNPAKARAAALKFRAAGGERAGRLRARYGISQDDYDAMLQRQRGGCAICKTATPGGGVDHFHVDHDHDTGEVRGLLCSGCNRGLGYFGDDADRIAVAAAYLLERRAR